MSCNHETMPRKNKNRQEESNNVTSHGSLFEIHCGIASVVDIDWLHVLCLSTWTQRSLGDIGMQPLILKFWSWNHFEAKHVISFTLTMISTIYTLADVKTQSAEDCRKICEVEMRDLWFLTFQHLSRVNYISCNFPQKSHWMEPSDTLFLLHLR